MAKRKREITQAKIERFIKERRGQGTGKEYLPWLRTRRQNVRRSNTGNDIIVTSGRGGKNSGALEEVSTQDSIVGGETPPIDFQTLETIPVQRQSV